MPITRAISKSVLGPKQCPRRPRWKLQSSIRQPRSNCTESPTHRDPGLNWCIRTVIIWILYYHNLSYRKTDMPYTCSLPIAKPNYSNKLSRSCVSLQAKRHQMTPLLVWASMHTNWNWLARKHRIYEGLCLRPEGITSTLTHWCHNLTWSMKKMQKIHNLHNPPAPSHGRDAVFPAL